MWRLTTAAALAMLAGCGKATDPDVFPVPLAEAQQRLLANDFSEFRRGRQCGILIFIEGSPTDNGVHWQVSSSGQVVLGFSALLTPVDATHTKVTVQVDRDAEGREQYDGSRFYPRPAVHQPIAPGVREQVAAILENRPFDVQRAVGPKSPHDEVCSVQRAGFEAGHKFSVNGNEDANRSGSGVGGAGNWGTPSGSSGNWGR